MADAVRDMWIGPVDDMRRMRQRATWERTPDLGAERHVSLHGHVVVSTSRRAPRTTTLTWDNLPPEDADALTEYALLRSRVDNVVCVLDPDGTANLLTPEQSRSVPYAGTSIQGLESLYHLSGDGELGVYVDGGRRQTLLEDFASGDILTWLHPYFGERGWPVIPGTHVEFRAEVGVVTPLPFAPNGTTYLEFRDIYGDVTETVEQQATGFVEAEVPEDAATVSPRIEKHLISTRARPGTARLSYRPFGEDNRNVFPLGNGCPVYSIIELTDTPYLPWRTTALELQEVSTRAYR